MIEQVLVREEQAARGGDDAALQQQRDNLCAAFHGARILCSAGFVDFEGTPIDQDLVALHAGTKLPAPPEGPQVPAGAVSLLDYRHRLPRVEPGRAGTTPGGLAEAIVSLSGGRLECVPVRGGWSATVVEGLLDRAASLAARLIANIRTGPLWVSRPPIEAVLALLAGAEPPEVPGAEWDVGHFVELTALVRGRGGALVIVRDSYPSLGWNAHHLQPPELLARALTRDDGREGGVLAVVAEGTGAAVRRMANELSLEPELWDNENGGS
jgi:Family of unknown function (DUF6885)